MQRILYLNKKGRLVASDSAGQEQSKEATLLEASQVLSEDGKLVGQLRLVRSEGGYAVHGEWRTKKVEAVFKHPGLTSCTLDSQPRTADLLAGKIQQYSFESWSPDERVDGVSVEFVKRGPGSPRVLVVQDADNMRRIELASDGLRLRYVTMGQGGARVAERAWVRGELPDDGCQRYLVKAPPVSPVGR